MVRLVVMSQANGEDQAEAPGSFASIRGARYSTGRQYRMQMRIIATQRRKSVFRESAFPCCELIGIADGEVVGFGILKQYSEVL
jgi:hypothetical protein